MAVLVWRGAWMNWHVWWWCSRAGGEIGADWLIVPLHSLSPILIDLIRHHGCPFSPFQIYDVVQDTTCLPGCKWPSTCPPRKHTWMEVTFFTFSLFHTATFHTHTHHSSLYAYTTLYSLIVVITLPQHKLSVHLITVITSTQCQTLCRSFHRRHYSASAPHTLSCPRLIRHCMTFKVSIWPPLPPILLCLSTLQVSLNKPYAKGSVFICMWLCSWTWGTTHDWWVITEWTSLRVWSIFHNNSA